jgi:hypothetical protein
VRLQALETKPWSVKGGAQVVVCFAQVGEVDVSALDRVMQAAKSLGFSLPSHGAVSPSKRPGEKEKNRVQVPKRAQRASAHPCSAAARRRKYEVTFVTLVMVTPTASSLFCFASHHPPLPCGENVQRSDQDCRSIVASMRCEILMFSDSFPLDCDKQPPGRLMPTV